VLFGFAVYRRCPPSGHRKTEKRKQNVGYRLTNITCILYVSRMSDSRYTTDGYNYELEGSKYGIPLFVLFAFRCCGCSAASAASQTQKRKAKQKMSLDGLLS